MRFRPLPNRATPHARRAARSLWLRARGLALLLALTSLDPGPARAEVGEARYDLQRCLDTAVVRNSDLLEADRDLDLAEVQLVLAQRGLLPQLEYMQLFGAVNEARGDAVYASSTVNDFLKGLGPFTRIDARLIQPLWTWGRIDAGEASARAGVMAKRAGRAKKQAELLATVRELFGAVVLNRRLAKELGEIKTAMEKARSIASERLEEKGDGSVTQTDVLKLDFAVGGMEKELVRIGNGEALAYLALKRTVGLDPEEGFDVSGELELDPVELRSESNYLESALAGRPELAELGAGIAAKAALVDKAKAELRPALFLMGILSFGVAPNRTDQLNPFVRDDFNFIDPGVVLGVRWNFSFLLLERVREAEARHARLLAKQDVAESGIRVEVQRAYRDVTAAKETVVVAQRMRRTMRAAAFAASANYELGIGEPGEVLELLGMFARATSELQVAIYEHNKAVAQLIRAAALD